MTRRALVTGASGFVGRHLTTRLLTDGWHVHALSRRPAPSGAEPVPPTTDLTELAGAHRFDAVFHLAAAVSSTVAHADLAASLESNVGVGLHVLDAFAPHCPIVLAGTMWQHVAGQPYRPASLYAAMKQAQLDIAEHYALGGATVADVELTDVYGPGDDRPRLLGALLEASRSGVPIDLTPGDQLVDLVHVVDVVEGLIRAAAMAHRSGLHRWAIASGAPLTVRRLVERCESAWERTVPVRLGARPYRAHEMFTPWTVHPGVPGHDRRLPLDEGLASLDTTAGPTDPTAQQPDPLEEHRGAIHARHS